MLYNARRSTSYPKTRDYFFPFAEGTFGRRPPLTGIGFIGFVIQYTLFDIMSKDEGLFIPLAEGNFGRRPPHTGIGLARFCCTINVV